MHCSSWRPSYGGPGGWPDADCFCLVGHITEEYEGRACFAVVRVDRDIESFRGSSRGWIHEHTDALVLEKGGPSSFAGVPLQYMLPLKSDRTKGLLVGSIHARICEYIKERRDCSLYTGRILLTR